MVVATKTTLVINAAFLQEIKDSNPDFWNLVCQLEDVSQIVDEPTRILRRLTRLLDDLMQHLWVQNAYLTETTVTALETAGFAPYWHQRITPNDGGVALGQIGAAVYNGDITLEEEKTNVPRSTG